MSDNSSVDVDSEMERHLKRAIDKEEAKMDSKKTKTGEDVLPEISIDEAHDAPTARDVKLIAPVLDSFSRLQINADTRGEKELMSALASKQNRKSKLEKDEN